jgi:hypothetical protein
MNAIAQKLLNVLDAATGSRPRLNIPQTRISLESALDRVTGRPGAGAELAARTKGGNLAAIGELGQAVAEAEVRAIAAGPAAAALPPAPLPVPVPVALPSAPAPKPSAPAAVFNTQASKDAELIGEFLAIGDDAPEEKTLFLRKHGDALFRATARAKRAAAEADSAKQAQSFRAAESQAILAEDKRLAAEYRACTNVSARREFLARHPGVALRVSRKLL